MSSSNAPRYHNFQASLAKGHIGEKLFLSWFPDASRTDGRKSDFILSDGTKLELKTDSYDMSKTANFFVELYSDVDKAKPGGPAQALLHGSTLWAYLYIANNTLFIFDTKAVLARVESLLATGKFPLKYIPNKSWTTVGVAIPRDLLLDLATVYKKDTK